MDKRIDKGPEYEDVVLDANCALDPELLVPPKKRKFGEKPDIQSGQIRIRIHRRPEARNLRALYESSGKKLPPGLDVFLAYDIWVISTSISVFPDSNARHVRELGYEIEFPDKRDGPRITVLELFPETKFITRVETGFEALADFQIGAEATLPEGNELTGNVENFGLNAKLSVSTKMKAACRIGLSIRTRSVVAVGKGDCRSEWLLKKEDDPLEGDFSFILVLLTPRVPRALKFRARAYATVAPPWTQFFRPSLKERSKWVNLSCDLL